MPFLNNLLTHPIEMLTLLMVLCHFHCRNHTVAFQVRHTNVNISNYKNNKVDVRTSQRNEDVFSQIKDTLSCQFKVSIGYKWKFGR